MAQQYGLTWWGQQWLQALSKIDLENRLPRGRSYANTGKVKKVEVRGNTITALVQGSRPKPYDVVVKVPLFSPKDHSEFMRKIIGTPVLLSFLVNRELPPNLLRVNENAKGKLFPQSWKDLSMSCSCPDYAVPCKHLAAVIYTLVNEIDRNPFLVFQLKGLELDTIIGKMTHQPINLGKQKIHSIESCLSKTTASPKPLDLHQLDFSGVPHLSDKITARYQSRPLFYNKDFKAVLEHFQNFWSKQVANNFNYTALLDSGEPEVLSKNSSRFSTICFCFYGNADFLIYENAKLVNWSTLQDTIIKTPKKHLHTFGSHIEYLYHLTWWTFDLIQKSAIVPRLVDCHHSRYRIHWIPAMMHPAVQKIFQHFVEALPQNLVVYNKKLPTNAKQTFPKAFQNFQAQESVLLLISAIAGNLASQAKDTLDERVKKTNYSLDTTIDQLFFSQQLVPLDDFHLQEIPSTIQVWLNRFNFSERKFLPLLQLSETEKKSTVSLNILVSDKSDSLSTPIPLKTFVESKNHYSSEVLKDLQSLLTYIPPIQEILEDDQYQPISLTWATLPDLLKNTFPLLQDMGISVLLSKNLQNIYKPKLSISIKQSPGAQYLSLDSLLKFEWKVAVGDQFLDLESFRKLVAKSAGLIKMKDGYMQITPDEIADIYARIKSKSQPNRFQLLQTAFSQDYQGASVQIDADLKKQIKDLAESKEIALPNNLQAVLRPYQHRGYDWMYKNSKLGFGSILADDMGLGKTLQVITLLLKYQEEGNLKKTPALVIAPTTLLSNWEKEIQKFAPKLKTYTYHGKQRNDGFKGHEIILTTYGTVRSETVKFSNTTFKVLVIDEAQNIKNDNTNQTKAIKHLKAEVKIALSGTPVENRLREYWSLFDFALPNYLGKEKEFQQIFAKPIEVDHDQQALNKFLSITAPFVMRRLKTDKAIISDLPDKIENNQYCHLSKEQAALYQNTTDSLISQIESSEGINRKGAIFKLLTALKQICNHPNQYLKSKANLLATQSGKVELLFQLLETIYENDEKVLIFSQYREAGDLLNALIAQHFGKTPLQLHGGSTRKDRDEMVDQFQHETIYDTFILSLKAGGTGLNLTAATHVIHFDLWWNPAVEAQASDRAYRIGQRKNVIVHRLITRGTLEEKIDEMIKAKKNLANLTVSSGEKWLGELSDHEIRQLVQFTS